MGGIWLLLIGPDGVGKTSVLRSILDADLGQFSSVGYHHWIPAWNRPLGKKIDLGGSRAINFSRGGVIEKLLSVLRLSRNVCRAWAGYLCQVRPALRRGELVLGDRYLLNYLLDPSSVRYFASGKWVKFALKLVPRPHIVVSLVAAPEIIHARKPELTIEEIRKRLDRTNQIPSLGWRIETVSAEPPLDEVVKNTLQVLMQNRKANK